MVKEIYNFSKLRKLDDMEKHLEKKHSPLKYKIVRFFIYGAFLTICELVFYNIIKFFSKFPMINELFKFQWRVDSTLNLDQIWTAPLISLYGQASLYMIFVYGIICTFWVEKIFILFNKKNFLIRGLSYSLGIGFLEVILGWILYHITGYRIWYYADSFNLFSFTSLSILWIWAVFPLSMEPIIFNLLALEEKNKILKSYITEEKNYRRECV